MYNGIGLTTVRGSGTNGHVQKNLSFVSQTRIDQRKSNPSRGDFGDVPRERKPNADIIQHNRKRDVELKVMELMMRLEKDGVEDDVIEEKTSALRERLLAKMPDAAAAASTRTGETHADAASKQNENAALKEALGISSDYKNGYAFDREAQAEQKAQRIAARCGLPLTHTLPPQPTIPPPPPSLPNPTPIP